MGVFAVKLVNRQYGTVAFDVIASDNAADAKTAAAADPVFAYEAPTVKAVGAHELISDLQPNRYGAIDPSTLGSS